MVVKITDLAFGHRTSQLSRNSEVCNLHYYPSEVPLILSYVKCACLISVAGS